MSWVLSWGREGRLPLLPTHPLFWREKLLQEAASVVEASSQSDPAQLLRAPLPLHKGVEGPLECTWLYIMYIMHFIYRLINKK